MSPIITGVSHHISSFNNDAAVINNDSADTETADSSADNFQTETADGDGGR